MTKDIPAFAFPIDSDIDINRDQPWCGMTLSDYFAGQAMQAMMSDPNLDMGCNTVATLSYRMADAMMKAREA